MAAEPLEVTTFGLQTVPITPPAAKEVAQAGSAEGGRPWVARDSKAAWNALPAGAKRDQWLSIVTVGFSGQGDVYGFMFQGPDGALSQVSHIPFRQVWLPNETMAWIWPLDELTGAVRVNLESQAKAVARRPLNLRVVPWRAEAKQPADEGNLNEARSADPKRVFDSVAVMAHAAAFQGGWAPTPAKSDWNGTCEVRVEDQTCSFRLTLEGPSGKRQVSKDRVSCEAYHDHLVRLFRFAQPEQQVSDFAQLKRGRLELLGVEEGRLGVLTNQDLTVFELQTGKRLWTTETPASARQPADRYTSFRAAKGGGQLLQFAGELAQFEWATGKRTVVALSGADHAHGLDGNADEWVLARGNQLTLVRQRTPAWSQKEPAPISAGPLLRGEAVIVGDVGGDVTARSKKDGALLWKRSGLGRLQGSLVAVGEQLLAFSSDAEALIALDAATGAERWRRSVGDVLLQAPLAMQDQLLVATKSHRLLLLDAKSGEVRAQRQWPTWLIRVTRIETPGKPTLVVTDMAGALTLLSASDLKPARSFDLFAELTGPVVYCKQLSPRWPVERVRPKQDPDDLLTEIEESSTKNGPALLVADTQGFVYILPLSKTE